MQILIIYRPHGARRLLNQEQLLVLCNAYVPKSGPAERTNCELLEFQEAHFVEDLALLHRTDIMVCCEGIGQCCCCVMLLGQLVFE